MLRKQRVLKSGLAIAALVYLLATICTVPTARHSHTGGNSSHTHTYSTETSTAHEHHGEHDHQHGNESHDHSQTAVADDQHSDAEPHSHGGQPHVHLSILGYEVTVALPETDDAPLVMVRSTEERGVLEYLSNECNSNTLSESISALACSPAGALHGPLSESRLDWSSIAFRSCKAAEITFDDRSECSWPSAGAGYIPFISAPSSPPPRAS